LKLKCENLSKSFFRIPIFQNISFELKNGDSLAITGGNGSGKSTLIKIIAGLIQPDKGKIVIENGIPIKPEEQFKNVSLIAPYINLFDELTGKENLDFFYKLKSSFLNKDSKKEINSERCDELLNLTGLYHKRNDIVKNYSSGMKQRLKVSFALLNEPDILLMDEPGTNLDREGKSVIEKIATDQKEKNILIIATNDSSEKQLCDLNLSVEDFKN
jgi:ABC-type multidrug transport system ATPase subunit